MVISVSIVRVITGPLIRIKTMENRVIEIYCEDRKKTITSIFLNIIQKFLDSER